MTLLARHFLAIYIQWLISKHLIRLEATIMKVIHRIEIIAAIPETTTNSLSHCLIYKYY
jgi:hypothetical protein